MRKSAALLLMALNACVAEPSWIGAPSGKEEISFDIRVSGAARSSISPDESALDDLTLVIYDGGVLYATRFYDDPSDVSLSLDVGRTYDVYALANAGEVKPAQQEDEFLSEFCLKIGGIEELDGWLPMSSSCVPVTVSAGMPPVRIELVRLVSKVNFAVENDVFEGLYVESVRLCQSALKVFPFNDFGGAGSKVSATAETTDGDYASDDDIGILNSGGTVSFYTLENCQGVLLPDNADPWLKVPESLGNEAYLATYIEVGCRFDEMAACEGTVLYRFYLGKDACSDFNVVRNSDMTVTLCLTEEGIDKVSWKVEADVDKPGVFVGYVFDQAEYLFQYSCFEFPSATEDSPVMLEAGGKTISITGEAQELSYNVYSSDGSTHAFFFCVPQEPLKVFFNVWHAREPLQINLSQGAKSETLTCVPKDIRLMLRAEGESESDIARVCESGLVPTYAYVYLADEDDGRILDLESFFVPDVYAEHMGENPDFIIREASVCLEDMYGGNSGKSYVSYPMGVFGPDEGENYIQGFEFYGLMADDEESREVILEMFDDNVFILPEREVALVINPAFPGQSHLGEYQNTQFAPGDLRESDLRIGLPATSAGGDEVLVDLRRVTLGDLSDAADQAVWDAGEECDVSATMSSHAIRLHFPNPTPADYKTLACGSMMAKASVVNPISGRLIEGFYTFDLVLYLSVGLQVDISDYEMNYSFVPFCEWTKPEYSDFWNDAIGGMLYVKARDYYGGGFTEKRVQIDVPKSDEEHPLSYTLPQSFSAVGQDVVFDEIVSCLLPLKNSIMEFSFYTSETQTSDVLEITRNKASSYPMYADYADGAKGYFRIVRQQDAGNLPEDHGLENNLVEVAYGSFEAY